MLVCPNCESETNGLKLNNRLYCTECGFSLSKPKEPEIIYVEPEAEEVKTVVFHNPTEEPQRPSELKIPKIIADNPEKEFSLAPLEAEEEVLTLVEEIAENMSKAQKEPKIKAPIKAEAPVKDKTIKKHNRKRTDQKKQAEPLATAHPRGPKAPKVIPLSQLEAEEEILEIVEEKAKELEEQEPLVENVAQKAETEFELIPGEPDPINEPEIEAAELQELLAPASMSDKIEGPGLNQVVDSVRNKAFHSTEPSPIVDLEIATPKVEKIEKTAEMVKETVKPKNDFLLNYFKQVNTPHPSKQEKKRPRKKKHLSKTMAITLSIVTAVLLMLIGLVLYVNLYANKPHVALNKAEETTTMAHLKPTYVPYGYQLSTSTVGQTESIIYAYLYAPDKKKTLAIKAEKTDLQSADIKKEIVDPSGKEFENIPYEGIDLWFVGDNSAYFIKSNVLYSIEASTDLAKEELALIAAGLK